MIISSYFREKALAKTNHQSVEQAAEWLLAHEDDSDIDEPYVAPQGHILSSMDSQSSGGDEPASEEAVASDPLVQARSLRCDE